MTEDEAKTKWCPYVENRGWKCIASACMAWRWHPNWSDSPENPDACTELPPIEGFCGLAGRP